MRKTKDLSWEKYNRLTVLRLDHKDKHFRAYWECKCECGKVVIVRGDCLTSGNTKACGCLSKELSRERLKKFTTKHGESGTRIHRIWSNMNDRCVSLGKKRGKRYADIGISICEEWKDYRVFKKWAVSNGYMDNLTIDRIKVKGNYCPGNCRWITIEEQQRNKEKSIYIEFDGKRKHLKEWAEILNIKYHTLYQRYEKNKDPEYVLRQHRYKKYRHGGKKI